MRPSLTVKVIGTVCVMADDGIRGRPLLQILIGTFPPSSPTGWHNPSELPPILVSFICTGIPGGRRANRVEALQQHTEPLARNFICSPMASGASARMYNDVKVSVTGHLADFALDR